jgi:PEP-CTERM motif
MNSHPLSTSRSLVAVLSAAALLLPAGSALAALAITNGTFGTTNQAALTVDGGGWFESTTSVNWVEGSWANGVTYPVAFPGGSGMALLMDGALANGYVYQSLGTVGSGDSLMSIFSDFAEKSDDTTVDCTFTVFAGAWGSPAHGSDVAAAGLTQLFTRTMNAADQGLSAVAGDESRALAQAVGNVNLTGQTVGTELWLRIGRPSSGAGDVLIDNVGITVTNVPEPTSALLGGLGLLALLRRRRAR